MFDVEARHSYYWDMYNGLESHLLTVPTGQHQSQAHRKCEECGVETAKLRAVNATGRKRVNV